MVRRSFSVALAGLVLMVGAGVALASAKFKQVGSAGLTATKAAGPTSARLSLVATDPGAPYEQPKAATRIVTRLPPGTVYNPKGALQCTQPPEAVRQCPDASVVGGGQASTHYGSLGGGETFDRISIYHRKGGLYVVVAFETGTGLQGLALVLRAKLSKRGVLTMNIPPLPAPPGYKAVITRMHMSFGHKPRLGEQLLTAPRTCDRLKGWRSKITLTYEDGSTQTLKSRQKCRPAR